MSTIPTFFVPEATPESQEEIYVRYAAIASDFRGYKISVPEISQRIYSIVFKSNGETWIATVGERLRGSKDVSRGRGRNKSFHEIKLDDPATVLAIFPGNPYLVVTNSWLDNKVRSAFVNPFMAGEPVSTTHFSHSE